MSKKAVVLLAEGFEEVEAATPVDVLRRAGVEVTVAGLGGLRIKGAHALTYVADAELEKLTGDFDLVVLPGGMPGSKNLGDSAAAKALTEKMFADDKLVASICAAPVFTLGAWGMLNGKNATCYAGMEGMFPAEVKFSSERVVIDGKIITSRGPGTALEFSLAIVGQLVDEAIATQIAQDMLVK